MAGAFVGGAALGALFGELLKVVEDVAISAVEFKSTLKQIVSILNQITPMIQDIENLNRLLDASPKETEMYGEILRDAKKLVSKCAKVKSWNFCAKPYYTKKLQALEASLSRFFQIVVQAQIARDNKKILVRVDSLGSKLGRMGIIKAGGFVGCCGAPEVRDLVVGFDEPLEELKMEILNGGGERVVVVSGPGGCGKTTLAKMICHDHQIKGMFKDNIFFVTASKAPNLKVIIEKLFLHKGEPLREFQTDEEAIYQLECMLKKIGPNPILLVLDDVWSGLESFIEDLTTQIPEIKLLVTSRFVFPRFIATYKLKLLSDQEAMALFCHSAFPRDGRSSISDDLVNKVVGGCGGFPLALKVVGGSLRGKPEVIWKHTLNQWSNGQSIFHSNSELLNRLRTTLDALLPMDKECYLDLASFPEDQRIPATTLMDMWAELYELDEDGEDAISNLHELSEQNLVNLVFTRKDTREINGYYNEHFVMQHDLLRDLAIHQSHLDPIEQRRRLIMDIRGNDFPKWWIEKTQHPIHARLMSISTDEMFLSNWHDIQLPKVEVLVLNIQTRNYTLPHFMKRMDQLKVLIMTNYGFFSAEISNFPLPEYLSSLKRIRLEHASISSISNSILQLRNLHKLSLIMCEIGVAFCNFTIQIPNTLPNLVEIVIDYCNDILEFPAWICNITSLEKLSITNCHELVTISEGFGKLENLVVLRFHASTKLSKLPESIGSLHKLAFLDLSDCISMSKLPRRMGELRCLRKINMRGCRGLLELPLSVKDLKELKDVICDEETAYHWEDYKIHLTDLKIDVLKEDINLDWLHDINP